MASLHIVERRVLELKQRQRHPRRHTAEQVEKIAHSIKHFGFYNPIVIDSEDTILAGIGRYHAAQRLDLKNVPTICLSELSDLDKRALAIADNRIAQDSDWDGELLAIELKELSELDFDIEITGFATAEIDLIIEEANDTSDDDCSDIPPIGQDYSAVTQTNDAWQLGRHIVACTDALDKDSYSRVLGGRQADIVLTDPPYNVPIAGHVTKSSRHGDFAMARGEMSEAQFTAFLHTVFGHAISVSRNGAVHFIFMDWRHAYELMTAARSQYGSFLNLCIWNKNNGGMGSLYRSKHELVFVFQVGDRSHKNNIQLGKFGRNRTNVWDYAGVNSFGAERANELSMHPTVKPLPLVIDAIKDVTKRGDLVLDPFAGSGTTVIAAEKCGRVAAAIEIDPVYVDVIVRRWQSRTGDQARLIGSRLTFDEANTKRRANSAANIIAPCKRFRRSDI